MIIQNPMMRVSLVHDAAFEVEDEVLDEEGSDEGGSEMDALDLFGC